MADFIDNTPPQNIDAERAVLAAMILDRDVVEEALAKIKAGDFYRPAHQKIYAAIEDLYTRAIPVDQLSLADRLEAKGELEAVGDRLYILELANNAFALANWAHHVDIVKRNALLRDLISASTHITALGRSATDDIDNVIEESEKLLFEVTNKRIDSTFKDLKTLLGDSVTLLGDMAENKSHLLGVPTGFRELDGLLAGMRGGDLLILAARPGVGKTSFALNIAINAAKAGTSVAFFSLEMPSDQLTQRLLCSEARVDSWRMRTGSLGDGDWKQIIAACGDLNDCAFAIDDTPGLSITELRAKARRQLRNAEKGLIVIDYLQLMQSHGSQDRQRYLEVGDITRGLKILAKELKVPVLALSQLSRAVEMRGGKKRPQLSDLRESGSIEQDADVVMFIDRSFNADEAADGDRPDNGMAQLMVAKHRNGATKDIDLVFLPEYTTFMSAYKEKV
ncbi:MAG: replicative DNA helicase [Coriobacteriales bacterium]|jgi:replicative DNA helicase|nr:replicative DNA helicase [Coriobacteriales bacterium]